MTTAIIDTSTANIASVRYALERLDARYRLAETPDEAQDCDRIILPGVGAAGPAMKRLRATGWASALQTDQRPLLGVCLGMQLLFDYSEESDCEMLGLIPGRIERLDPGDAGPWPHMGWNTLSQTSMMARTSISSMAFTRLLARTRSRPPNTGLRSPPSPVRAMWPVVSSTPSVRPKPVRKF